MKNIKKPQRTLYRHIFDHHNPRSGGVTVRADVDFETLKVKYSFSRCIISDNYDRKLGRKLCDDRITKDIMTITDKYNIGFFLVENIIIGLKNEIARVDIKEDYKHYLERILSDACDFFTANC